MKKRVKSSKTKRKGLRSPFEIMNRPSSGKDLKSSFFDFEKRKRQDDAVIEDFDIKMKDFLNIYNDIENFGKGVETSDNLKFSDREIEMLAKLVKKRKGDTKFNYNFGKNKKRDREEYFSFLVPPVEDFIEKIKRRRALKKKRIMEEIRKKKELEEGTAGREEDSELGGGQFEAGGNVNIKRKKKGRWRRNGRRGGAGGDGSDVSQMDIEGGEEGDEGIYFEGGVVSGGNDLEEQEDYVGSSPPAPDLISGKLLIHVSHAKDLIGMFKKKKKFNSCVQVNIDSIYKARVNQKDPKPTSYVNYNESIVIDITYKEDEPPRFLTFIIFDGNSTGNPKRNGIGEVSIDLRDILDQDDSSLWRVNGYYEVERVNTMSKMDNETYFGELYLQSTWFQTKVIGAKGKENQKGEGDGDGEGEEGEAEGKNKDLSPEEINQKIEEAKNSKPEAELPEEKEEGEDEKPEEKIPGVIVIRPLYATDIIPPLDEIGEDNEMPEMKIKVVVTYPDGKKAETKFSDSSNIVFPEWNETLKHPVNFKDQENKPLSIQLISSKDKVIGFFNLKLPIDSKTLKEGQERNCVNGFYDLKNSESELIGSQLYFQAAFLPADQDEAEYLNSLKATTREEVLKMYKGRGLIIIDLIAFSLPKWISTGDLRTWINITMPGGSQKSIDIPDNLKFKGLTGEKILARVAYEKDKDTKIAIKVFEYNTRNASKDELIASGEFSLKKLYQNYNKLAYNCIFELSLTPKYEEMQKETYKLLKKKNKMKGFFDSNAKLGLMAKFILNDKNEKLDIEDKIKINPVDPGEEEEESDMDSDSADSCETIEDGELDYCVGISIIKTLESRYLERKIEGKIHYKIADLRWMENANDKDNLKSYASLMTSESFMLRIKSENLKKGNLKLNEKQGKQPIPINPHRRFRLLLPENSS